MSFVLFFHQKISLPSHVSNAYRDSVLTFCLKVNKLENYRAQKGGFGPIFRIALVGDLSPLTDRTRCETHLIESLATKYVLRSGRMARLRRQRSPRPSNTNRCLGISTS